MSETIDPNKKPNYPLRRAVAASIAAVGLAGAGIAAHEGQEAVQAHQAHEELVDNLQRPDALAEYRKGEGIPHDKAVVLESPGNMTAYEFASEINADNVDLRDITVQITPQADAQLDPGLQPGEQVVVEKDLVSDQAVKQFGVIDINDPAYIDPDPASHQ